MDSALSGDRTQVNLPYVFWIAAYNVSFVLGYLCLDLAFFASPLSRSTYSPYSKLKVQPDRRDERFAVAGDAAAPPLLDAINKNGLVLFLLVCASLRDSGREAGY